MTVRELAGPRCCDIVVCPQLQEESDEAELVQADAATGNPMAALSIECSLLVLKAIEDMAGAEEDEGPAAVKSAPSPATRLQLNTPSAGALGAGTSSRPPSAAGTSGASSFSPCTAFVCSQLCCTPFIVSVQPAHERCRCSCLLAVHDPTRRLLKVASGSAFACPTHLQAQAARTHRVEPAPPAPPAPAPFAQPASPTGAPCPCWLEAQPLQHTG